MYGALSSPLALSGNFDADIDAAYEYFQQNINDRNMRPVLFDKEVFIEAHEKIEDRPQGFWHIISLEKSHRFNVLPCVNDENIALCRQNCANGFRQIIIKYGKETRNICLLRASRLPWIVDIINLANKGDPSVKVWLTKSGKKKIPKLYLRYDQLGVDYVVIFSVEKHNYRLISAFPVFYTQQKALFDEKYSKHAWSYFEI